MHGWIDFTLLLHAVLLIVLAVMIFQTARDKHQSKFWRLWPPAVLTTWGASEFLDGLIYGRRWLAQEAAIPHVQYYSPLSAVLNTLSVLIALLLILLIKYGKQKE